PFGSTRWSDPRVRTRGENKGSDQRVRTKGQNKGRSAGGAPPLRQALEALVHAHGGAVAEVTGGGGDVVPVRGAELLGQEAGQGRFAAQGQQGPGRLQHGAGGVGDGVGQAALHRWHASGLQQVVDDAAHRPRFAIGDEIGLAGAGRARRQRVQGQQVGAGGVVHVGGVHQVVAASDE